jgi:tRNA 2-selenouridine synthase
MPSRFLEVDDFVKVISGVANRIPLIDTRSEAEFLHACIPGAVNLPLLPNEDRKIVGTIYKQQGHDAAVIKGFELTGPRFHQILSESLKKFPEKELLMYCWRGGMRSGIMSWLHETTGFKVTLLKGGYKAFRRWVNDVFEKPRQVLVLGGHTGSGKTEVLHQLKLLGEQVIDLEALANHKGSAFGSLGKSGQPSHEQFENLLALEWANLNPDKPVWLENESRAIGSCIIPEMIFNQIRTAPVIEMNIGFDRRLERIRKEYACFPVEVLKNTTLKIKKRLGPQHLKAAIECLDQADFDGWLQIVMVYYDKLYEHGTLQRKPGTVHTIDLSATEETMIAGEIIRFVNSGKLAVS